MTASLRHQLVRLDQAILALANERARLCADHNLAERELGVATSDLLRRNLGPLSATALQPFFAALERACLQAVAGPAAFRAPAPEEGRP